MLKRTLSLFLAFAMVFSLLPLSALAEETAPDEGESLLTEPVETTEAEPETTIPSETEKETVAETEAETVPTEAETTPAGEETVPETEEALLEEAPAPAAEGLIPEAPDSADPGTWTLDETKKLTLTPTQNNDPCHSFVFTAPEDGDYIFWWDPAESRGNGPHVTVHNSNGGQVASGNVYASFHGAKKGEVYTIRVYARWDQPYTANLTLSKIAPLQSMSFQDREVTGYVGQRVWNQLSRVPGNSEFGEITWTSSDENVAIVSNPQFSACEVTLVGPGTATITAKSHKGLSAKFTVRVKALSGTWMVDETKSLTLTPTANGEARSVFSFTAPQDGHYIVHWNNGADHSPDTYVKVMPTDDSSGYSRGNLYADFFARKDQQFLLEVITESDTSYTMDLTLSEVVDQKGIDFWVPFCICPPDETIFCTILRNPGNSVYSAKTSWTVDDPDVARIFEGEAYSYGALLEMKKPGITTVTAATDEGNSARMQVICAEPIGTGDNTHVWLKPESVQTFCFVPPRNGEYLFRTDGSDSIALRLVDADGNEYTGSHFIRFRAEAGKPYTLFVGNSTDSDAGCGLYLNSASTLRSLKLGMFGKSVERITVSLSDRPTLQVMLNPVTAIDKVEWNLQGDSEIALLGKTSDTEAQIVPLTPGTVTLSATCGGKTASCEITIEAGVVHLTPDLLGPITPGIPVSVTVPAERGIAYQFTPTDSGTYVLWDKNHQEVNYELRDEETYLLSDRFGSRLVFEVEAGKTYWLAATNFKAQKLPLELHLEMGRPADSMAIANGLDTLYLYPGADFCAEVTMEPMNGIHKALDWSIEGEDGNVLDIENSEDDYCRIRALAPGEVTLEASDGTLTARMKVVVKKPGALSVGVSTTVISQGESDYSLGFLTPEVSGDYILTVGNAGGRTVSFDVISDTEQADLFHQADTAFETVLRLKAGNTYFFRSELLDEQGKSTGGGYSLCLIPVSDDFPLAKTQVTVQPNEPISLMSEFAGMFSERIRLISSNGNIVTIEGGKVVGKASGTAFVTACVDVGGRLFTARCRVDVAGENSVTDVQLSTTSPTVELYRADCTTVTILPLDADGKSVNAPEPEIGFARSAKLSDDDYAAVNRLFTLEMADSRTLRIVPDRHETAKLYNQEDGALSVKSSYTVDLQIRYADKTITKTIKLTVRKNTPKLTAEKMTFDSFITPYQPQPVVLSGGTVTSFEEIPNAILGNWIVLEGNRLVLNDGVMIPQKASGNVCLLAYTDEWTVPARVTVPVRIINSAPSLKLSASSVNIPNADPDCMEPVALKLLPGSGKKTLEQLNISNLYCDNEDFWISDFDCSTGSFLLHSDTRLTEPRTIELEAWMTNTDSVVSRSLTLVPRDVTIRARSTSVRLNAWRCDGAMIPLTTNPAGYSVTEDAIDVALVDKDGNDAADLFWFGFYGDALWVNTTGETPAGATYKLILNAKGSTKKTTITISTLSKKQSEVTASAKISGSLDVTFPESSVAILPTFKNYSGSDAQLTGIRVTDKKGNDFTGYFERSWSEALQQYRLRLTDPEGELAPGTYYLTPFYSLNDGGAPEKVTPVKFTLKRTAVALKLAQTSLTLNKAIDDRVDIGVACLTRDYELTSPVIITTASKGADPAGLTVAFSDDGKLHIAANPSAAPGKTYTVSLRARESDKAVSVKVTIAAEGKKPTATLKAKGTIDAVRDNTGVVITPAFVNYSGQGGLTPSLTIQRCDVSTGAYENADEFTVTPNDDGTFTVTRADGKNVDLSRYKYRARLSFRNGNCVDAYAALPVKSNTVKVSASGTPVLYKADGYSRDTFRLTISDAAVNSIAEVTSASDLYEIHDYGNGEYAIGFKGNVVKNAKYPASVKLNIRLDGNANAFAAVTLKLVIR